MGILHSSVWTVLHRAARRHGPREVPRHVHVRAEVQQPAVPEHGREERVGAGEGRPVREAGPDAGRGGAARLLSNGSGSYR